ncbi:hypothetical protein AC1031_004944 [Aphanomyces cochlioides]|nr:hypothetical protein AC1031_004944 [Aphanomyces cochlioides]
MVKLFCGVYGEVTVFSVDIQLSKNVEALQKAIVHEKADINDRFNVDPADLTLYLAGKMEKGKKSKWLADDDNVGSFLRGGVDKKYKEMRSTGKLNDDKYFGRKFRPIPNTIHVLVELPKDGSASETSTMAHMIEEMYDQVVQTQWKRYVHSNMSSIRSAAGKFTAIEGFNWKNVCDESGKNIALNEEQQRERYRAYVEENIGDVLTTNKLCVQ